ncbi:MAG: RagB/SusD family nutrient uptake outer membrane protein [Bacteroidales bacterium]|nr:RagB/SusD family nutrient uptake outer membrane protein [Bacteroidales bacterium]MCI1785115.1 RagB/SusD family nutrient uptake outer membrane protein [Bacteroidales bacterium]
MKKILYSILIAAAVLSAVSCDNFLTVTPKDSLAADNYYVSKDAIRANTAVLYASTPWFDFHGNFMFYAGDMMAGDMYYTYDQEGHYYYNSVTSTNSYLYSGWKGLYRVVSFANSVINDMPPEARKNGVSEDVIQAALGEAYTMRAMSYFIITEYWGEAPIIENATELITSSDPDKIYVRKSTQESLYKFMIRDLERAIKVLPEKDDPGRATKWSALGLLSKVQLTYAAYKKDASLYGEAKTNAKAAVDGGLKNGYGLWPDYSTMFGVDANNCCESLLSIQCKVGNYAEGNSRNANFSRGSRIADQTWGAGKGPTISLQNLYSSNDLRRKSVYMTLGDYYSELDSQDGGYTYYYTYRGGLPGMDTPDEVATENSNQMLAHLRKYVIGKPSDCNNQVGLNQDGGNNLYLLRFSDVMMVYIEACIGTGDATSDPAALDYMSQILSRAGLTSSYTSITFEDLIRERRKEFAMEGINWFDVKRVWYRDHTAGINYLENMNRDLIYSFNWNSDKFTYDTSGEPTYTLKEQYVWENQKDMYVTLWESMDITSTNSDGSVNKDYYKGAEWLEANGHRVSNIIYSDSKMYLPIPEAEATNSPILSEPAVDYDFGE